MTFEFAWKVMKDFLEYECFALKSPRETIKTAFQSGLVRAGHDWIDALSARNDSTHTYDERKILTMIEDIRDRWEAFLKSRKPRFSKPRARELQDGLRRGPSGIRRFPIEKLPPHTDVPYEEIESPKLKEHIDQYGKVIHSKGVGE